MKDKFILFLTIIVCFLLQSTLLQKISIGGITPNLLIILAVSTGLSRGKISGLFTGFLTGLLVDLFYGEFPGIYALLYMWMGYVAGFSFQVFYDDNLKVPMLLAGAEDLLYNLCVYVVFFLLQGRLNFPYYLRRIIIPEMIYTVILTAVVYRLFYLITHRLMSKTTKERTSSWLLK